MSAQRQKITLQYQFNMNPIFLGVFVVAFLALNVSQPGASQSDLFWYGIVFPVDLESLDLIGLGRWMLFVSPFILFACIQSEQELNRMAPYVIPRYRSYTRWWHSKLLSLLIGCLIYFAIGIIVTTLFMSLSGQAAQSIDFMNLGISLCLIFLHLFLISLLILASHTLFSNQHAIALGALGLEGLTLFFAMLNANVSRFLFGTWGMLYRSSLSNPSYGFDVGTTLLVQAIVCVIIIVCMPYVLKKRGVFSATRI
ncbi:MAG TPA: hypothetical protein PKA81_13655 [Clostridia bacterium]|nr:hypothetical protein [Clostridia bacterium]